MRASAFYPISFGSGPAGGPAGGPAIGGNRGSIVIRGGAGSIAFKWQQLLEAADRLGQLSDDLSSTTRRVQQLRGRVDLTSASLSEPTAMYALWRLRSGLDEAHRRLGAAAWKLDETAQSVCRSHHNYRSTEATVRSLFRARDNWGAYVNGFSTKAAMLLLPVNPQLSLDMLAGVAAREREQAERRGYRNAAQTLISTSPEYLAGVLGLPPHLLTMLMQSRDRGGIWDRPLVERYADAVRDFAAGHDLINRGTLEVTPLATRDLPPPGRGKPPLGSIAWAISGPAAAYDPHHPKVNIRQIHRPDGSSAWSVDVPGTQDWRLDSPGIYDTEGNLRGITHTDPDADPAEATQVMELVARALDDLDVPAGAPIILNGHSAGGIHAAALASNKAFLSRYDVVMLNTAGAPIANFDIDPSVKVLALEHRDDVVPALDGRPNPARANWVTATATGTPRGAVPGGGIADTLTSAHDVDNYVREAAALADSTDPAIVAHRAALAVLVPAGSTVTMHSYQGRDVNPTAQRRQSRARGTAGGPRR